MNKRVLSIDPSMGCTGWALVVAPDRYEAAGTIQPDGEGVGERSTDLMRSVMRLIVDRRPQVIVVEVPATTAGVGSVYHRQKATDAAVYGVSVGVVIAASILAEGKPELLCVPANVWPPRIKGASKDRYKSGRVLTAAAAFGTTPAALGPKTKAGNVADALLLGRWAFEQGAVR